MLQKKDRVCLQISLRLKSLFVCDVDVAHLLVCTLTFHHIFILTFKRKSSLHLCQREKTKPHVNVQHLIVQSTCPPPPILIIVTHTSRTLTSGLFCRNGEQSVSYFQRRQHGCLIAKKKIIAGYQVSFFFSLQFNYAGSYNVTAHNIYTVTE